jgi:hypothetical protein
MNQPRKNLAESVLARAELYRRGMLFDGVPEFTSPALEMPVPPGAAPAALPATASAAQGEPAAPAVPGAADALTAGAVAGQSPLETMLQP